MGRVSDDLSTNSMASSNFNNILENDTILSFEIWICIADGSGGFTSHLADPENAGSHHTDVDLAQDNLAAQAATTQNPPKNTQEEENFDLIKRYWTDPEITSHP